jgi:hypothetical protein
LIIEDIEDLLLVNQPATGLVLGTFGQVEIDAPTLNRSWSLRARFEIQHSTKKPEDGTSRPEISFPTTGPRDETSLPLRNFKTGS